MDQEMTLSLLTFMTDLEPSLLISLASFMALIVLIMPWLLIII